MLDAQSAAAVSLCFGVAVLSAEALTHPFQVFDCAENAGDALVVLGAGFELARRRIRRRAHFICRQAVEQLITAPQDPGVRTEKLIRRADQEIGVEILHVDWAVRSILHCVDIDLRASGVRHLDDRLNWVDGTKGVRCVSNCQQPRAFFERFLQVIQVERAIGGVKIDPADANAAVGGRQRPRRGVGVVIQTGDDNDVAGVPLPRDRTANVERQAGHIVAEDNFIRRSSVQEFRHGDMGLMQHRIGFNAGGKGAFVVGVV